MFEEENVQGMTDLQFLSHLRTLLIIAEKCKDLDEFKEFLKDEIETFGK